MYDLIRKFILTSVSEFVAPTTEASFAMFLLVVDVWALILHIYCYPYANKFDNSLSAVLLSVECLLCFC